MKNIKSFIILLVLGGAFITADAQYYYGPPPPGPAPAPRHRERQEKTDDEGSQPSGYFGITIGLAQPVGGFANAVGGGYSGYALPGDNIDVSLGIPINHSNMGIALMYGSYANAFDINGYVANMQLTDQTRSYAPIAGDVYSEGFLLAGLFITYPVYRFSFDFKLMGGFAFCSLPEVDYGADYNAAGYYNYEWDNAASRTTGFAYGLGADMRYRFRRASLMIGVDYLGSNPVINSVQTYTDPNGYASYTRLGGSMPISVVSANIGVAYDIR
ncbi:MAG TPA: hypothetical protein VK890_05535 [Bacteroidia bacterium]|jgi:hypothetical protein|nr:hypothetical protein [Bacteroidia bacterium]